MTSTAHRSNHLAPIDTAARARLVNAYLPGVRVVGARRLRGGIGARTQVLHIEDATGLRSKAVLRVYLSGGTWHTPERARREFRTIELVQSAGVPSPRPLFLDAEGEYLGEPAMLLSYLPGRSMYQPRDVDVWVRELACAMLAIHAVRPTEYDLSWLPRRGRDELKTVLDRIRERVAAHEDDIAREAFTALEANIERIKWVDPCLIHEDFWPGNTVWFRGKLTGVIDWANACLGDPRLDPAQCCIDSHLVNGVEVSAAVRTEYARLAPRPLPDQWFFDLYIGLRGLLEYEIWLIGYHDAGLIHITKELARERIHDFLRGALEASKN